MKIKITQDQMKGHEIEDSPYEGNPNSLCKYCQKRKELKDTCSLYRRNPKANVFDCVRLDVEPGKLYAIRSIAFNMIQQKGKELMK